MWPWLSELLAFVQSIIGWVTLVLLCVLFRKPISGLLDRLQRLIFRSGGQHVEIGATTTTRQAQVGKDVKQVEPKEREVAKESEKPSDDCLSEFTQLLRDGQNEGADFKYREHVVKLARSGEGVLHDPFWLFIGFDITASSKYLALLKESAGKSRNSHEVLEASTWLGILYREMNDADERKNVWLRLVARDLTRDLKFNAYLNLAHVCLEEKSLAEAAAAFSNASALVESDSDLSALLRLESSIAEANGDSVISALLQERAAALDDWDPDAIFRLAYSESNTNLMRLSIANYAALLATNTESHWAANNLAVISGNLDLPTVSISLYSKAAQNGNSLALANIGYAYLDAGFVDDAEKVVQKALELDDVHENIHRLQADIKIRCQAQQEKWQDKVKSARSLQAFVRRCIAARSQNVNLQRLLAGGWLLPTGEEVKVELDGSEIKFEWIPQRGIRAGKSETAVVGSFEGKCFLGEYIPSHNGIQDYLLADAGKSKKVIGLLDESSQELELRGYRGEESFTVYLNRPRN